jgi:hypothetical protein
MEQSKACHQVCESCNEVKRKKKRNDVLCKCSGFSVRPRRFALVMATTIVSNALFFECDRGDPARSLWSISSPAPG